MGDGPLTQPAPHKGGFRARGSNDLLIGPVVFSDGVRVSGEGLWWPSRASKACRSATPKFLPFPTAL